MSTSNFDRYDLGDNVREDLIDIIYNIDPTQTPFMTTIGTARARQTYHEWQTDNLHSVDPNNARVDGADAGNDQSEKSIRIGNTQQISDKVIRVSGRADVVNKAGRRTELAYQLAKASKSIKRDMEAIITGKQAAVAGDSSNASKTGALGAWLTTNTLRGATGSDGGFSAAPGPTAPSAGTPRAFTETLWRQNLTDIYIAGGEVNMTMVGPVMKQRISEYLYTSSARVATLYKDTQGVGRGAAVATGSVDVFVSDFGAVNIVPNRFQGHNGTAADETDVYNLTTALWALTYLRTFRTYPLARTGDAENRQMIVDYGLRSNNEAGSGVVADIDSTAPMTAA